MLILTHFETFIHKDVEEKHEKKKPQTKSTNKNKAYTTS